MITRLHAQRLVAVEAVLRDAGARTVLDLGCGDGALLLRLAGTAEIVRIVGVEPRAARLAELGRRLAAAPSAERAKVELIAASLTDRSAVRSGFDAAVMVETLEHLPPERLGAVERAVFRDMAPALVVVTTPNADFNELLGVPAHRRRHPDHRFEWGRARLARWAAGVAARHGYAARRLDVAATHPQLGAPTQMAVFRRAGKYPARARESR
ncbi:MAG: methyltransferase domain-containing protein [Alphaproteobacteria bacterium]